MIDVKNDILSLTDFKRKTSDVLKRVKERKTPAVLTVNGAASVVVLDAGQYQEMSENAQRGVMMRGIEAGLKSMRHNKGIPAQKVFDALRQNIQNSVKQQG